jgi:putative transcriptional regulator
MSPRKARFFTVLAPTLLALIGLPAFAQSAPSYVLVQTKNPKALGPGKVLVASRQLGDPHFVHTVVLLVHYDAQNVVGLVLNRRTEVPLSRVFDHVKQAKDRSDPVYVGGPVEMPSVFALLQSSAKVDGAEHIFGDVYMISDKPLFEKSLSTQRDPRQFHVYLGYAGWSNEQLKKEVELGAWFIFPGDVSTVFNSDPESLWPQMIGKTELEMAGKKAADVNLEPNRRPSFASRLDGAPAR